MPSNSPNLKRAQLNDALGPLAPVAKSSPPGGGWLRAIREALGMTQGQLAARVGVSRQAVQEFEGAEVRRCITLESMDKLAAAMGCRVVYAVVPVDATIDSLRTAQARAQAEKLMGPVSHSMAMEAQAVPSGIRERQLKILMEELQSGSARNLWK